MGVKELRAKYEAAQKAALAIFDQAKAENRGLTEDEQAKVAGYEEEMDGYQERITQLKRDADMYADMKAKGLDPMGLDDDGDDDDGISPSGAPTKGKVMRLGDQLVQSGAYKTLLKQFPGGHIPQKARVNSDPVEVKDLLTGADSESAGAFVVPDDTGLYEPLGRQPLPVLGLLSRTTTASDTVEYVRQTQQVTEATVVPEANVTDYSGATSEVEGLKPEAAMAFERVSDPVKTIAAWIAATKRALADANQIRGIINSDLMDDLMEELEYQIVNGDGVGDNFTGILNTTGVQTQAWDTDLLTTIRRARTALEVTGRSYPSAILMHPNDIETLDLLTDDTGRFYYGGPATGGVQQVWRVRVVDCQTMPEGYGLMGDFKKARFYDRQQATITVSDSHEDFFVRNMVAILAELRAALAVVRPTAFIVIELESGS